MTQILVGTVANDGTGDPLRTAFLKINKAIGDVYNILSYGAVRGGPDCAAAVNTATAAAIAAGGGIVYFPAGQYYFLTSPTTLTGTCSVTWQGEGRNATYLVQGAAGVTVIPLGLACTRFFARDLWIGTFQNFATGGGINATAAGYPLTPVSEFGFENITFENLANPISLDNAAQGWFRDCRYMQTRVGATIGHVFYLIRTVTVIFDDQLIFVTAGTLPGDAFRVDSDCDTILCWKCEHVLLGNGVNTAGFRVMDSVGAGVNPPRIIRFTDCTAENGQVGFQVNAARDVRMQNCEVANHNTYGFYVTGGNSIAIVNSLSFLNQQHGIYVSGGAGITIEGNTCSNNSQQVNATYDGIVIGTTGARVWGNRSGDFLFTLANKQRTGLNLVAGSDFLYVGANDLQGNTGLGFSQPIINNSTGANNQFCGSRFLPTSEAVLVAGIDTESLPTVSIEVTLTAARLVGAVFTPYKGQRIVFTFIQSGAGAFAVTWNAVYKTAWADAGNATPKRSSIAYVYDGTNWNQDGAQAPYV